MREIQLTQGKIALVDDEDYEWLSQWKWCVSKSHNGFRAVRRDINTKRIILMHRQIVNAPPNMQVDHWNRNSLDNRRGNLRICTNSQNNRNKDLQSNNTSGYKGVSFHKQSGKYQSKIQINGKHIRLGLFNDIVSAAKAYDKAAIKYHGEYAKTNF